MKLKQISFVMENCEVITIDGKYIGDFRCGNIEKSIERIACNSIMEMNIVKDFAIEISKDANKEEYCPFGFKRGVSDPETIFDRICKYSDITSVEFDFYDENKKCDVHYEYYVDWCGDSEYTNSAQQNYISDLGNLYIVICQTVENNLDKVFEIYFDKIVINDKDSMVFRFNMFDVPFEEKGKVIESEEEIMANEKKIQVVPESDLEVLRNKILSCNTIFEVDDVLTDEGFMSAEGKTGFLRGLFNLSAPSGNGEYGKYEAHIKIFVKNRGLKIH